MRRLNSMEIASLTVMFAAIASFVAISSTRSCSDRRAVAVATASADSLASIADSVQPDTISVIKKTKAKKTKTKAAKTEPKSRDYRNETAND